MLDTIRKGKRNTPPRLLIYGTEGIGKSTFASNAPKPIFIPTEDGLDQIDCDSFPIATEISHVTNAISTLITEPHEYSTVVIDSADWMERLVWDELCVRYKVSSIEKVDGGYAKGYTHALTPWREILSSLERLRVERGMAVIMLAHAKVEMVVIGFYEQLAVQHV